MAWRTYGKRWAWWDGLCIVAFAWASLTALNTLTWLLAVLLVCVSGILLYADLNQ